MVILLLYYLPISEHKDAEPCYDSTSLHVWDFSDWTERYVPLENILKFMAVQSSAIHTEDPKVRRIPTKFTVSTRLVICVRVNVKLPLVKPKSVEPVKMNRPN